MTVPQDMAERHSRMLARYAELSLSLAEDVHAAAVAAPEPAEKARLAMTFTRLGRSLRQSIAWEARLVRERARDLKTAEAEDAESAANAVRRRQDQVKAEVERQIYSEVDLHDAPAWLADLEERLESEALYDGFLGEDLDDQVARLSADLGLTGQVKRNYIPRGFRPGPNPLAGPSRIDYPAMLGGDDEADDDEDEGAAAPLFSPAGKAARSPAGASRRWGSDQPPDEPPPIGHSASPSGRLPPEAENNAAQPPPEPEPPPRPPDPQPEPYIPPWERNPNRRRPGGSGY